jgi:transposase-like protein
MNQIYTIKSKPPKGKRDYRSRRVWSLQQKQEIPALAKQTSTLQAARAFDVDIRLLFQWRAHERMGELAKRTWKDPGRPKRRNRRREEIDAAEKEAQVGARNSLTA